jgi:hypothetical protein
MLNDLIDALARALTNADLEQNVERYMCHIFGPVKCEDANEWRTCMDAVRDLISDPPSAFASRISDHRSGNVTRAAYLVVTMLKAVNQRRIRTETQFQQDGINVRQLLNTSDAVIAALKQSDPQSPAASAVASTGHAILAMRIASLALDISISCLGDTSETTVTRHVRMQETSSYLADAARKVGQRNAALGDALRRVRANAEHIPEAFVSACQKATREALRQFPFPQDGLPLGRPVFLKDIKIDEPVGNGEGVLFQDHVCVKLSLLFQPSVDARGVHSVDAEALGYALARQYWHASDRYISPKTTDTREMKFDFYWSGEGINSYVVVTMIADRVMLMSDGSGEFARVAPGNKSADRAYTDASIRDGLKLTLQN